VEVAPVGIEFRRVSGDLAGQMSDAELRGPLRVPPGYFNSVFFDARYGLACSFSIELIGEEVGKKSESFISQTVSR